MGSEDNKTIKVFIDGAAGATGLALEEKLLKVQSPLHIEIIKPEEHLRKDVETRREFLNKSNVAFLCLPDAAAKEAAAMVENGQTVIIDASTAHRTSENWAYGFPELSREHRRRVETLNRITVPGCHASGFAALVYPLVKGGFIDKSQKLYCHSLTGYSGGGKELIQEYEGEGAAPSPAKLYALGLNHKHLPEMRHICGLDHAPVFSPVLINIRQGMVVSLPLDGNARTLWDYLDGYYRGAETISVMPFGEQTSLEIEGLNHTDTMEIYVFGGENQALLAARFDNLGKGSSGAALQCMKVRMNLCNL